MSEPSVSMTDTVNTALKSVLEALQSGVTFAKAEIPLLLKEKLAYDFYSTAVELGLFLLVAIGLITAFVKFLKYDRKRGAFTDYNKEPVASVVTGIAGGLWSIITLIVTFHDLDVLFKISLAPRLYLMEWLVSIIKK